MLTSPDISATRNILEVHQVAKRFRLEHLAGGYLSLRETMVNLFKTEKRTTEDFWALQDINFAVKQGETLGIVGRNGAGKSTLLKILSKITPPTKGRIVFRGRLASLLEVGTGFHPELTGRENIYFNGSLLGMKREEIKSRFDGIVDFSGTERFLDTQLKHFSSGMQLRLAFSVAAFLEPEILVIDEVLAVGDAEFQQKCLGKMEDVSKSGRTIIFVSHDLNAVSGLCSRVIVLDSGKISFEGPTLQGISHYLDFFRKGQIYHAAQNVKSKPIHFKKVMVCDSSDKPCSSFLYTDPIFVLFELEISDDPGRWNVFVMIQDERKRRIFASESGKLKGVMKMKIEPNLLVRGNYSVVAYINQANIQRIDEVNDVCPFEVLDNGSQMQKHGAFDYGSVFGRTAWIDS